MQTTTISYFHHDHLGSISAITDQNGAVTERMAYDPWGKRRNIATAPGTADTQDALYGKQTDRGFTLREHLDEMGIIHMNGRVYDPLIGRFMSADPFIQSPMDLQSYNRYAYVRNNPLTMSDPTGHFWWWVVAAIVAPEAGRAIGLWDERTTRILQGIGLGIVTGGATVNWFLAGSGLTVPTVGIAAAGGAVGGFVSGAVITGTLDGAINGAVSGAFSGALFNAAGMVGGPKGEETFGRYAAHAAAGCVTSAAGGGSCGQGAVSAVFGKYTTNQIGSSTLISGDFAKGVATAVAGGVGSMIAGGKFENGAVTAGFGYLFNFLVSERRVRFYNSNTGEIEIVKRFVVSFSLSSETDGTPGLVGEYADKGLKGISKRAFGLIDFLAPDGYGTPDVGGIREVVRRI